MHRAVARTSNHGALTAQPPERQLKWCSREDSHLEPPPSQSGMQNSYTSGAENGAPCRCRPGAVSLEETRARCYTNDANESGGCVRYRAGLPSSSARC